jgi:hypothetical protein
MAFLGGVGGIRGPRAVFSPKIRPAAVGPQGRPRPWFGSAVEISSRPAIPGERIPGKASLAGYLDPARETKARVTEMRA